MLSRSIESSKLTLIYCLRERLSSGSFELAKLDSTSTFYCASISSRLSNASLFRKISLNSFSDRVSLIIGFGDSNWCWSSSWQQLIRLRDSIWLAKSIIVRWICIAPTPSSTDSMLSIEQIECSKAIESFLYDSDGNCSVLLNFSSSLS